MSSYYNTATIVVKATTIGNTQVTLSASTPCSGGSACLPSNIPVTVNLQSNQEVMLVALYATATYNNTPNTVTEYVGISGTNITESVTAVANAPYTPNSNCYTSVNVPISIQAVVCVPYLLPYAFGIQARNPSVFATALNIYNITPSQLPSKFPQACTLATASVTATINVDCAAPAPSDPSSQSGLITTSNTVQVGTPTPTTAVSSAFNLPSKYYAGAVVIPQSGNLYLYEVVVDPRLFVNGITNAVCGTQTSTCYDSSGNLYTPVDVWLHIPLSTIGLSDVSIKLFTITNINQIPTIVVLNQNLGQLNVAGNVLDTFTSKGWTSLQTITGGYYSYTYLTNSNMYITISSGSQASVMEPAVLILAMPTGQAVVPVFEQAPISMTAYVVTPQNQPLPALVALADYSNYSSYLVPSNQANLLTCTGIASAKDPEPYAALLVIGIPLASVAGAASASVGYVDVEDNQTGSAITVGAFIWNDYQSGAAVDVVSPTDKRHCSLGNDTVTLGTNNTLAVYILSPSSTVQSLSTGFPLIIKVLVNYNNVGGNLIAQVLYKITITPSIPLAQLSIGSTTVQETSFYMTDLYVKNVYCGQPPPNCPTCPAPQFCTVPIFSSPPPLSIVRTFNVFATLSTGNMISIPQTINLSSASNLPSVSLTPISAVQPLSTIQVKACLGNKALGVGFGRIGFGYNKYLGLSTIQFTSNVWNCSPTGISGANPASAVVYMPTLLNVPSGLMNDLTGEPGTTSISETFYVFAVPTINSDGSVSLVFDDADCASVSTTSPTYITTQQPTNVTAPSINIPYLSSNATTALLRTISSSSFTYNMPNWYVYTVCGPLTILLKYAGGTQAYSFGNQCFTAYVAITNNNVFTVPSISTDVCNNTVNVPINDNVYVNLSTDTLRELLSYVLSLATSDVLHDLQSKSTELKVTVPQWLTNILKDNSVALGMSINAGGQAFALQCTSNNLYTCVLPTALTDNLYSAVQSSGGSFELCVFDQSNPSVTVCKSLSLNAGTSTSLLSSVPYTPVVSTKVLTSKTTPDKPVKVAFTLEFVSTQQGSA